jgi:phosphocarrier protein HPr
MECENQLQEETLTVTAQQGLHARVATMMVQGLRSFSSQVTLVKDGVEVDGRSVLGLLLLAATSGSRICVRAEGPDSGEVIKLIKRLVQDDDGKEG